ncbi:MAG: hypothetical protein RIQ93_2861 [Verrucomicrobiota bacterium]
MVSELARPGGRMVGSEGHFLAEQWLERELAALPLDPYDGLDFRLPYEAEGEQFANFAAVFAGEDRSLPPVLLGAHYDSVIPHPCADDNAAAVAIVLCAAAELASAEMKRDVVIAIFDAEEPPYFQTDAMGSVVFSTAQSDGRGFAAAIILDLVGHNVRIPQLGILTPPAVQKLLVIQGAESHAALADLVCATTKTKTLSVIAASNHYLPDMSDHYAFRHAGVPFLFLSCGQWEHYHQPTDTPDRLNYRKMSAICELTCQLVQGCTGLELAPTSATGDLTAELEADSIRRAFGPLLRLAGIQTMERRADVDRFAAFLLRAHG